MTKLSKTFKSLIVGALVLPMATICHAERPVQILYCHAGADAPSEASLYSEGSLVAQVELPRDNFSESFEIPKGDIKFSFLPGALEKGAQVPEDAPSVDISAKWEKILLLVIEDNENATMPIRVQAVDASDKVFRPGSIYMNNFSEVEVVGTIGDKEIVLNPGDAKVLKRPVSKAGSYPVKLEKRMPGEDSKQRFIRQMWVYDEEVRQVLFILPKGAPQHATYYCAPLQGLD